MAIAIINDDADELADMTRLAAAIGIEEVHSFAHPACALDWCETNTPDLVYVDFLMRASDGLEVIRHLRAVPTLADVPLVLMLPRDLHSVSASAIQNGATDFLAKPIDPAEFQARTRNLLALRAARAAASLPLVHHAAAARHGAGALRRPRFH
ncbi:MAG: response regulator [Burkholderiales bacterium]|nr:response regulator [Burkholderiales bacterium]